MAIRGRATAARDRRGAGGNPGLILLAVAAALATSLCAHAVEKKFDGGTSGTGTAWNSTTNWNPDGSPVSTDSLTLDNTFLSTLPGNFTLTGANLSVQAITFNANTDGTLSNATSTSALSRLTLNGTGSATDPLISMGANAVSNTFTFRGSSSGGGSGTLSLVVAASGTINVTNPGAVLAIPCVITESGAGRSLTKIGQGTVSLTGQNSFSGGVFLNDGVLSISLDRGLGQVPASASTNLTFNGGTLRLAGATTDANRIFNLAGDGSISADTAGGAGTINGVITGGGAMTKSGSGSIILIAASNYTGTTTISAGTLTLSGSASLSGTPKIIVGTAPSSAATFNVASLSSSFTLSSTQTLAGHGRVVGPIIVGGIISPGTSVGVLTTDNETWAAGGAYAVDLDALPDDAQSGAGTSWDLLQLQSLSVTATSASNFTVKVLAPAIPGWDPNQSRKWKIATFTNNPTVDLSAFKVDTSLFDQNNTDKGGFLLQFGSGQVDLVYVVPEPSSAILVMTGLFWMRRNRRRSHR
jgi:autotransporter-associated beta strand protein